MNKAKINLLIGRLKNNALKLRGTNQLPSYLIYLILKLDKNTSEDIIRYLMACSEHMLRLKGYYKKYPSIEAQYNNELKEYFKK